MKLISFRNPVFICLLIFFSYLIGLWKISIPLTGDQKTYLSIALEMYEKKSWIIPTLFNEPNFLKPPFQYWATVASWNIFGISIFGSLLPSVLALIGCALLIFQLGKKLNLREPGIAAVLFSATLGTMTYGSTAQMEIWIVLFLLSAWLAVLSSRILLAYILVGIMAWVKGPLYPALWTFCLLMWQPSILKNKKFWFALVSGIAVGLGWYVLAAQTNKQEILSQFFFTENLGKMSTRQGSILSLWNEFIFSLFPWAVILILSFFHPETRYAWRKNSRFYLSYSLIPAIFFTLFPYRVNTYLYFLTPVLAMMTSEASLQFTPRIKSIANGIYGTIFIIVTAAIYMLVKNEWIGAEILVSMTASVVFFMIGFIRVEWKQVALGSLLIVNLIRVSAVQIGEKEFSVLRAYASSTTQPLAYFIDSQDIWHEYGLVSAALGQSIQRIYDQNTLDSFLAAGGALILQDDQNLKNRSELQCIEWSRLKRRAKFPIQRLMSEGLKWGDAEITRTFHICKKG